MKNHFNLLAVIAVAILFRANVVSAQTFHSLYSPSGGEFLSFVNTTDPNHYESWYIFTDNMDRVIINKMDYNFPCLKAENTWAYKLASNEVSFDRIYLKDCFFVPDGSAIFCYGWEKSQMRGVMLRININVNAGIVTGIDLGFLDENSPITSACWAHNTSSNQALYGKYFFGIIAGSKAASICFDNLANMFAINGARDIFYNPTFSLYFPLYSISYDPAQNYFLVSGTYKDRYVLCTKINNNSNFTEIYSDVFDLTNFAYNFEDGDISNNVMTITNNGTLFLAQSIRTYEDNYLIWLINYNYHYNTMVSSTLYKHLPHKSYLSNIAIGSDNNMYILGYHNTDIRRKFLLQFDMQNPASNYKMQHMTDVPVNSPSLYSREMEYLSSMSFSNIFSSMEVSGAFNGKAFIVHAFDLNNNNCDEDVNIITLPHSYYQHGFLTLYQSNFNSKRGYAMTTPYTLNPCEKLCWDMSPRQLQEQKSQIEEKNKTMQKLQPQIKVMEKQFVVHNFEGNCKFKIVDMLGRTMQQGSTQNGVVNQINISTSGIYIISVTDEKNSTQNSKAVISQ